jgi:hypothetical protein
VIAVSSFRPHAEDPAYAKNQIRARQSWDDCFESVHYFGQPEPSLDGKQTKTFFLGSNWPTVRDMASFASGSSAQYAAILNADIVVSPLISRVERQMLNLGLPAATSYRYEFDPSDPVILRMDGIRNRNDRGMDIFIATPQIWGIVADKIPAYLRIGHPTWDTWICGFFCSTLGRGFVQFTEERVVFHPKHEGRKTPYSSDIRNDDPCFTLAHVPSPMPL